MFPQPSSSIYQSSTCFVTYGTMGHVDLKQPPQRSEPWMTIAAQDFIHKVPRVPTSRIPRPLIWLTVLKVDLIVPRECYAVLHQKLVEQRQQPCYARVTMTLGQVLEGDFFTEYIKKGDILMLSEGRATTDNTFTLRKGTLTMYLDKETFERGGLVGKPYGAKGNRGFKPRWVVSYDLTSPSMVHGKRGFSRLLRACETVLDKPLEWLFCNAHTSTSSPDPLEKYKPVRYTVEPTQSQKKETAQVMLAVPSSILSNGDRPALEETATELYEWLSLVRLQSPRVAASDTIDPYLSRYTAPSSEAGCHTQVYMLSWQGCIAAGWLRDLVTDVLTACSPQQWFSISATGFSRTVPGNSNDLTLLRPSGAAGEYLMWETRSLD
ncbi:Ribonuclease P protein subunit p40 [Tolypocladium ophioglossoides CBS 100239]|uniref:Ribonuclease P protein subunit p40 n=1 Tax=Tolypocladium ophioglossoides (strain CBS 100239) TaxID=1163406 RepID=A0A0L0N1A8_TOLOC|nr:Ribonuclease P protein subunit p40 [Tolypocladium ophioglossoides CBS 100239]